MQIARQILLAKDLALSTQVLQEFYWAATRPHKLALTHGEAAGWIDLFRRFPIQPVTLDVVDDALYLCSRYQLSYWDAAIVAAARHMNSAVIYSKDLSDGQIYEGVEVRNPFSRSGLLRTTVDALALAVQMPDSIGIAIRSQWRLIVRVMSSHSSDTRQGSNGTYDD